MVSRGRPGRTAALALGLGLGCVAGAPATQPRPSEPAAEERVELAGGALRVVGGECGTVDLELIREWAERAREDLSAAWPELAPRFRPEGLSLRGERDPRVGGRPAHGYWRRATRTIVFRCGDERVVRHELFHAWCESAELPCDCARIDHPRGFDLDCKPKPP